MRLIDADTLKKDLTRFYDGEVVARKLIDEQQTIDAVPVRHGRWERGGYDDHYYICSQCGYVRYEYYEIPRAKYCEHCGAKMDGGDGSTD